MSERETAPEVVTVTARPDVVFTDVRAVVDSRDGADGRRYGVERVRTSRVHSNGLSAGPDTVVWRVVVETNGRWIASARSRARGTRASCVAEMQRLAQ